MNLWEVFEQNKWSEYCFRMSDVALWGRGIIACVFISGADAAVAALICLISDRKPAWDNTQAVLCV